MKYSIITINYNDKEGIAQTIKSVISQTNKDYEYIIIDGGSTDGSVDIIKENQNHITYWVSEKDKGVYHAMNKGIAVARGEYCIFMNSGDIFHSSDVIETLSQYKEDIICGKVLRNDFHNPVGHNKPTITLVDLMRRSLPHQAMVIKTELLVKHPYDEKYKILSDWKFCIEAIIFDNCTFRNIDYIVADFDLSGISTTAGALFAKERELIIPELFPERIFEDYRRFTPIDDELLDQVKQLTQTITARKIVKRFIKFILWFHK